jgi:MFS family permease
MTRITRAWGALGHEQRLAATAAIALLVTMFFPWYDLQSLNRKTGVINSHSISAFGDVSFVEAAVFLVAAGVIALMFARAERRDFHMPGSDGAVVMVAGAWATLLIFYRVFSRPDGHGYPVGIEWGFLLAFLAAGVLTFAGWRMRAASTPEAPLVRERGRRRTGERPPADEDVTVLAPTQRRISHATSVIARPVLTAHHDIDPSEDVTSIVEHNPQRPASTPQSSPPNQQSKAAGKRSRFPPPPSDQLSFEDPAYHSPDDAR